MSPSKALRRALSRAADVLWDLALVVHAVSVESLDQDGVVDSLSEETLLVLLDGPGGVIGLAELDRDLVTGIVEVQTIQQVTSMPPDDRPLSPTDAAMMAPLLDNVMERFASYLVNNPLLPQVQGYRFGAMIEDTRNAAHILDASVYRSFRADIDLALGRRKGRLSLLLPEQKRVNTARTDQFDAPGPHEDAFKRVPVRLDCRLARITVPLHKAEQLRAGDLLTLSDQSVGQAELHAAQGQVVAGGRLGQLNGMRALRLTWPAVSAMAGAAGVAAAAAAGAGGVPQIPDFSQPQSDPEPMADFSATLPEMDEVVPTPEPSEDIDFAADAAAFDMGEFSTEFDAEFGAEAGDSAADASFDIGSFNDDAADDTVFAAESSGDDLGDDFASAPLDFDFNEQ